MEDEAPPTKQRLSGDDTAQREQEHKKVGDVQKKLCNEQSGR